MPFQTDSISSEKIGFYTFTNKDIIDFVPVPTSPSIEFKNYLNDSNKRVLIKLGLLVFSPEAWKTMEKQEKDIHPIVRSPSLSFILRRALIQKEIDLYGIFPYGENGKKMNSKKWWFDMNFPWDVLYANKYLSKDLAEWYNTSKSDNNNLGSKDIIIVSNDSKMTGTMSKKVLMVEDLINSKYKKYKKFNISKFTTIKGSLIIPEGTKSFSIEEGAVIEGNCVISDKCEIKANGWVRNSILKENVVVEPFAVVKNSILLKGARIMYHSVVLHSILGKDTIIGPHTTIASKKVENISFGKDSQSKGFERYYTEFEEVRHSYPFGAIIGDRVKIGMNVSIEPGRKIGRDSIIHPELEVDKNIPPGTINIKRKEK